MRSCTAGLSKREAGKGQEGHQQAKGTEQEAPGQEKFPVSPRREILSPDTSRSPLASSLLPCPEIVVVGTSLGGLNALEILLGGLPKSFSVPVAIAQHRHKDTDDTLSLFLQHHCVLPVTEAEDKEAIVPGQVYLAPADYHLLVESSQPQGDCQNGPHCPTFSLSTEAPVCYARPSINVLFESVADAYGEKAIGVILTGASDDGSQGLARIKANGGQTIVQEPTTAFCPTMPKAAIEAVAIDWILPLPDIAPLLVNLCHPALR